jgi:hypothetical protein
VVEVPLAADRSASVIDQHAMLHPHVAVEVLHQPLPASRKQTRRLVAQGIEMLAVHHSAGDRLTPRIVGQLRVESPLVGGLVFKGPNA